MRAPVQAERDDALMLRYEVQDSGIGIAATDQIDLFDTLQQADGSTSRRYGGTGPGLAITRRLAMLMGSAAGVTSEAGLGSTVWFMCWLCRGLGEKPIALAVREQQLADVPSFALGVGLELARVMDGISSLVGVHVALRQTPR